MSSGKFCDSTLVSRQNALADPPAKPPPILKNKAQATDRKSRVKSGERWHFERKAG
jgi:hypothetical protein